MTTSDLPYPEGVAAAEVLKVGSGVDGVEENRPTLEALVRYMHEQHFIDRKIPIEELFVKNYGHTEPAF